MLNPIFYIALAMASFSQFLYGFEMTHAESTFFKNVQKIHKTLSTHMVGDGFRVLNYFPSKQIPASVTSPFILLDYNEPFNFPPSPNHQRGVGAHPHRGFETVTLVYEGSVAHRDSFGNGGVIESGEVQWMTAGSGILHEEYQDKEFCAKGGVLHAVQLWINLPAKDKMSPPKYQALQDTTIAKYPLDDKGSIVRVIAGAYRGVKGAASTHTPMHIYDVRLKSGSIASFDLPAAYHTMLLITKGSVEINDKQQAAFKDLVVFAQKGNIISLKAHEDSMLLVLSAEPINEPVVQAGPFVMNTHKEINQAYRDYQAGKFGKM